MDTPVLCMYLGEGENHPRCHERNGYFAQEVDPEIFMEDHCGRPQSWESMNSGCLV